MFRSPRILGISFLKGQIQMAEIEHGETLLLTALAEGDSMTYLMQGGAKLTMNHPQLKSFVDEIEALIKDHKILADQVSFALPSEPLFINIIPFDPSLKGASQKMHLVTELLRHQPDANPAEYILNSDMIPGADSGVPQAFMVGLPRGMVGFLENAAKRLRLKMNIVDVDQFSVEKTVMLNYPEILRFAIVLFGLRIGGVDASLIQRGRMTDFQTYTMDPTADPSWTILEYLRTLADRGIPTPEALILHGVNIPRDLIQLLRKKSGVNQTLALNAVRKLRVAKSVDDSLLKSTAQYGAAIGLALRKG